MTGYPPKHTNAPPDSIEPDAESLSARIERIEIDRFIDGTRRWRSPRLLPVLVGLYGASGLLPLLPGSASLSAVPLWLSLSLMGGQALIAVVATVALSRESPIDRTYRVISFVDPAWWSWSAIVLIGASGSAASIYWLNLAVFVVLMATTVRRHATYRNIIGVGVLGLIGYFAFRGQYADALYSFLVGGTLLVMQRLSTVTGSRADRERARAELIAEQATEDRARWERERIARELHDGVGADLTALLWETAAIDNPEAQGLSTRIQESIASLRVAVQQARHEPMTARKLATEVCRVAEGMVASTSVALTHEVLLQGPDILVSADVAMATVHTAVELVRNAVTHGDPSSVVLRVEVSDTVSLRVHDDGVWERSDAPGDGLVNIGARASELGGRLEIHASPSDGTTVMLSLPTGFERPPSLGFSNR